MVLTGRRGAGRSSPRVSASFRPPILSLFGGPTEPAAHFAQHVSRSLFIPVTFPFLLLFHRLFL